MAKENLIDVYHPRVSESEYPGIELTKFYCEVMGKRFDRNLLESVNKLVMMYGRDDVFSAVCILMSRNNKVKGSPYNYLASVLAGVRAKNRMGKLRASSADLTEAINNSIEAVEDLVIEVLRIPMIFEEDANDTTS